MSLPRTRMGMLAGRARLRLARQGQGLLERKRDALLRELYREVPMVYAATEELNAAAGAARLALVEARTWVGRETVAAAASAAQGEVPIDLDTTTVMGLAIPAVVPRSLVRSAVGRGRAVGASGAALELVAERFEQEVTIAIRLATIEARVRRLAREVRRTNSRVNALRTRVIPRLEAETKMVALALDQRERDDRHRFKRVKSLRAGVVGGRPGHTGRVRG